MLMKDLISVTFGVRFNFEEFLKCPSYSFTKESRKEAAAAATNEGIPIFIISKRRDPSESLQLVVKLLVLETVEPFLKNNYYNLSNLLEKCFN